MNYESGLPSALDMADFAGYRPIRPLPKRKRGSIDYAEFPENLYDELQHLPMDAAFMDSLPSMFSAPSSIDPTSPETYFPLFQSVQPELFQLGEDDLTRPAEAVDETGRKDDEDERGDGDYVDHLQNPGNTKKRKVPGARHTEGESPGKDGGEGGGGGDGTAAAEGGGTAAPEAPVRLRLSRATLANMRQKERLSVRRRQFENIIPAETDPLTVELALSSLTISGVAPGPRGPDGIGSKRRALTKKPPDPTKPTRQALADKPPLRPAGDNHVPFLEGDFSFRVPSATTERLVVMRGEIKKLHANIEEEINRQAAKAAEDASKLAALVASNQAAASKSMVRDNRLRKRPLTGQPPLLPPSTPAATALGKQKKKKRSAIANASNPHHFRNYIPSRLPYSGHPPNAPPNAQSLNLAFGPLPLQFIEAQLPSRRNKRGLSESHDPAATVNPADEWICSFCDYHLFYAEEPVSRKAVRSRKRILRRRRRARERAAAAAAGTAPVPSGDGPLGTYPEDLRHDHADPDGGFMATGLTRPGREGAG